MANSPFLPPPGLVSDDTVFAAPGRWRDGSMVRFRNGNWQVKGGWERLTLQLLGGVCRAVFGWSDQNSVLNVAFGTHATLEVWQGGAVYNITPYKYPTAVALANNPIVTANGSQIVQVIQANDFKNGERVTISGATSFDSINPNGTWTIISTSSTVWTFNSGQTATGTNTGGGAAVTSLYLGPIDAGQIDGTGGAGFGTGAYGVGNFGEPSTADYFPLTWSLGAFGSWLIANPRGRPIYVWKNNLTQRAAVVTGAPAKVTYTLSVPQRQLMALGCNEEVSGTFNPLCIRWSDIEDINDWASLPSNNAGEYILEGGGRIVCGRVVGNYVVVWTDVAVYLGTFLGSPSQTWSFERVSENCGCIAPGAPVVRAQVATWISPDHQFWAYPLGGAPSVVPCPIRDDFAENVALGQYDKIVGCTLSAFQEVAWFYPDARDGLENSRDLSVGPDGWCRGRLGRTGVTDAGPHTSPIMTTAAGDVFWHEKGNTADGGPLTGFIESTDFYLEEAQGGVLVNGCWPNLRDQLGVFQLSMTTREHPQATERQHGPWALQPGQEKRSFRASGRIARFRFDFSSAPCWARAGKFEFDIEPIGGR